MFSFSPDIIAEKCHKYGTVYSSRSPDPSRCCATGKGLEVAVVEEKSSAIMEVINCIGEPCEEAVQSLQCELVSELTCATVREKRTELVRDQLPTHHQGEAPTPHQSGGPAHQRISISYNSEVTN